MTAIDPSVMTVQAVKDWVLENWHDHRNDATFVAVHNAERDGQARVSLLDWLDHFAEDHSIDVTPAAAGDPITLSPTEGDAGSTVDLTVTGTGFIDGSVIVFDGAPATTTFVSDTELTATITLTTVAGDVEVAVDTAGELSGSASFSVLAVAPPLPDPGNSDETLTAQLFSWGVTGEPIEWAPTRWQAVIFAIRAANLGFGDQATVQGLLDTTFPLNDLQAADVCITPPTVLVHSGPSRSVNIGNVIDSRLPGENITWLIDGVIFANGRNVTLPTEAHGEHRIEVRVAVAGTVFTDEAVIDIEGVPAPEPEPEEVDA